MISGDWTRANVLIFRKDQRVRQTPRNYRLGSVTSNPNSILEGTME